MGGAETHPVAPLRAESEWAEDSGMWKKSLIGVFAGALAVAASVMGTAEAATQPQYVALGDSYAAGDGAGTYLSDGTSCHRSLLGYPGLVSSTGKYALNLQACSGATTGDVLSKQLTSDLSTAAYVTVTVGGNDIGFADVLTTCLGTNTTACVTAVTAAETKATAELPTKLDAVLGAIKAKATSAKIVATNYPRLFNGSDCSLLTSFTKDEMTRLNKGADTLSSVIKTAADKAGIGFVDVRTPFVGHAVCDRTSWIRNASLFKQYESFHPNASGYQYGYTPSVVTGLGATTSTASTMTVKTGGKTSSDTSRGEVRVKA